LFEDFAVVEVGMSKYTTEASSERAKVSMGGRRDVDSAREGEMSSKPKRKALV
jgi:hypothetical protein